MNACRSWHCMHSNVRRSTPGAFIGATSLIEVSPPHVGHRPSTPMGADWGACTLYPFALERAASPWKVQVLARTSCDRVSIMLEPGPIHQSSLCNIDHSPHLNSAVEPGFECHFGCADNHFQLASLRRSPTSSGWARNRQEQTWTIKFVRS
jgi:hypothetical protein